jgi:hypothetical protein
MTRIMIRSATMSGPFDKELESITTQHTQDFARKLAFEVQTLILRKLGIEQTSGPGARLVPAPAPGSGRPAVAQKKAVKLASAAPVKVAPVKKAAPSPPKKRANGEDRASTLDKVFRVVQSREGVAVSEIVKATTLDRGPVAAALKALKEEGRIFMGGNRRFARYAMNQSAADRASEAARKG